VTAWLTEALIASSLLMALILLIRGPVARTFGPRAAFALWLAPLARLLLPPLRVEAPAAEIFVETQASAAAAVAPVQAVFPLGSLLLGLWAGGALLFLVYHLLSYRRFVQQAVAEGRPVVAPGVHDAAVIETPAVGGPAASGLLTKRIFVPSGFAENYPVDAQRLAVLHEALHHRRGDLWASTAALLVLALHWFNPLAYAAHRAFRRDLEAACDAQLLATAEPQERELYGRTILRCAARATPQPVCALTDTQELKGRLEMMKRNFSAAQRACGTLIAAGLTVAGLTVANPAAANQEANGKTEIVDKRIVRTIGGDHVRPTTNLRELVDKCESKPIEAEVKGDVGGKKQHTRIVLCAKGSGADAASRLDDAVRKLEADSDLPAAAKAEIIAKLRAQIAELRAGK
jgi:beta-lactamase regulating signal transducer with metallopeptidase domain